MTHYNKKKINIVVKPILFRDDLFKGLILVRIKQHFSSVFILLWFIIIIASRMNISSIKILLFSFTGLIAISDI